MYLYNYNYTRSDIFRPLSTQCPISQERIYVEHLIRIVKIFRVAAERFRLHYRTYKQVMLVICGLARFRIGAFKFSF